MFRSRLSGTIVFVIVLLMKVFCYCLLQNLLRNLNKGTVIKQVIYHQNDYLTSPPIIPYVAMIFFKLNDMTALLEYNELQ